MAVLSRSGVAAVALATGMAVVAGTGGAVAGAMITGRQIKDGTVTGADLSAGTKTGLRRVGGYTMIHKSHALGAFEPIASSYALICPAGTRVLSYDAFFAYTATPDDQLRLYATPTKVTVHFVHLDDGANEVVGTVVCGRVA